MAAVVWGARARESVCVRVRVRVCVREHATRSVAAWRGKGGKKGLLALFA